MRKTLETSRCLMYIKNKHTFEMQDGGAYI